MVMDNDDRTSQYIISKNNPLITPALIERITPYLDNLLDQIGSIWENIELEIFLIFSNLKIVRIGRSVNSIDFRKMLDHNDLESVLIDQYQQKSKAIFSNLVGETSSPEIHNFREIGLNFKEEFANNGLLILPVLFEDIPVGYLTLFRKNNIGFHDKEINFAKSVSTLVSGILIKEDDYLSAMNKADEAEAFLSVQQALTSQLELDSVLQLIVDEARRLTNTRTTLILLVKGDNLRTAAISGPYSPDVFIGYEIPINSSNTGSSILQGRPVHVYDAENNPTVYRSDHLQVKSFISAPLMLGSKGIGAIMFADKLTGAFNKDDERVAGMFASSAVIAIENARLYHDEQIRRQEAEQRRRVAEGLQEILKVLNSHDPLTEILKKISRQICGVLQSDACVIYQLMDDGKTLMSQSSFTESDDFTFNEHNPIHNDELNEIFLLRRPGIFNLKEKTFETTEESVVINSSKNNCSDPDENFPRSIAIPLSVNSSPYGLLFLFYKDVEKCTAGKVNLASIVGDQVSLAIENANLRQKTEDLARLQERQRIAQALHDSVAQMLFSLGIEVEELLKLGQIDTKCEKSLQTIRLLTARSSHELRTAIFTLREEKRTVNKSNLIFLIEELVATFRVETGIPITFINPGDLPNLHSSVTEAIYRIVRESLSNIYKHSKASAVIVNLTVDARSVHVLIQDDGIGLDLGNIYVEGSEDNLHFGIATMHQLANQAQGKFRILNGEEQGVIVKASIPLIGVNVT